MKLSTRLTIAMVALVMLTATAIGVLTYRNVTAAALPLALERLDNHARVIASELASSVRGARADVIGFRASIAVIDIMEANLKARVDPSAAAIEMESRRRLAQRFVAELTGKRDYAQFRVIGVADGGREIVRVDRSGPDGAIRIVPDAELQRKGDRDYFKLAIAQPEGAVYVAPVDLNRERGVIETPYVPTLRTAAPVYASDGKPFGIVIINVDLRPAFDKVRAAARGGAQIYVVNERGDYLMHPDRRREFGFELGMPSRVQDEFPALSGILGIEELAPRVMADASGTRFGVGLESARLAGGPLITVIEKLPYRGLVASADAVRDSSLLGALAAVLGAIALAVILARSLTKPLVQITRAVAGFARDESLPMPLRGSAEVRSLAEAFSRMANDMREKTTALYKEIEERSRIFDTSPDLIMVTDRRGNFTRVSRSSEAILGYRPDEMVGGAAVRFIVADDLDSTRNEMRAARRGRAVRNFLARYRHKDGREVLVAWSGVWSEPTQQYFFVGRDMTEQKLAEVKFRLAVEASPSGLVMIDGSGTIVLINAETERLFGYKRHELLGQPVDILVPVRMRGHHVQHRDGFAARPEARRMGGGRDLYGLRKDGTEFPVEIGLNPIHTQNGLLVLSVIVDISERKRAEAELRKFAEREQLFSAAVESSDDAIITKTLDGIITGWNPAAEQLFGFTAQEAIGRSIDIIVPEERRSEVRGILEKISRGEKVKHHETVRMTKAGRSINVSLSISPVRSASGEVTGAAKIARDITDKLAAEEQLRQAQKMESVGQLTGGIAHDFNNMLTVITGTIDILGEAVADKPQLAAIAKLISEAADRGAELTGHLLAFARKQPLQPRETDINALMVESEKLLRPALGEHIEIELSLAETAWPALVDPTQLTTALLNLAVNARDAMPHGGKLMLETSNVVLDQSYAKANGDVQPGNYVLIAVSDTGGGIAEAIRQKIFEPFFTTKDVGKGTGLGLSMVYGFVKQSGGHIKVYSEEGHGTTFKIYLPRAGAQPEQIAETLREPLIKGGTETILVVEDAAMVRTSVITQLQSLGYKTLSAANAAEALAISDTGAAFDLLFTDVIMPGGMNGRQLAEEMARRRSPLKVLFTSGYTENAIIHHGRLDPGVLLLAKPYRKSDLARMVRQALTSAGILPSAPAAGRTQQAS